MTKKAKVQRSGFFQPRQPVASSTTLSADGRHQVVAHKVFDFNDTAVADVEPLQNGGLEQLQSTGLYEEAGAPPAPEPVEGLKGVSVITTTHAKRYANSVRVINSFLTRSCCIDADSHLGRTYPYLEGPQGRIPQRGAAFGRARRFSQHCYVSTLFDGHSEVPLPRLPRRGGAVPGLHSSGPPEPASSYCRCKSVRALT